MARADRIKGLERAALLRCDAAAEPRPRGPEPCPAPTGRGPGAAKTAAPPLGGRRAASRGWAFAPARRLEVAAVHHAFGPTLWCGASPASSSHCATGYRCAARSRPRSRPGSSASIPTRSPSPDDAEASRRPLLAGRNRRPCLRRPAHGLRPLGASPQPRARGARLHRLPVERPHNSFVVLDGGELVTKDCDAPRGTEPSTVSALDPARPSTGGRPLRLPEPSIARLSGDGESVIAVGTTTVFRLRLDRDAGRLTIDDDWRPRYGPAPERSYGWDPVITGEHVFWMDNGRNHVDHTMLGSGDQSSAAAPVVGTARRRRGALGSGQRTPVRDGVEPARVGSRRRDRRRLRRRQRGRPRVAAARRRARVPVAPRRARPRRPPDRLSGHA